MKSYAAIEMNKVNLYVMYNKTSEKKPVCTMWSHLLNKIKGLCKNKTMLRNA